VSRKKEKSGNFFSRRQCERKHNLHNACDYCRSKKKERRAFERNGPQDVTLSQEGGKKGSALRRSRRSEKEEREERGGKKGLPLTKVSFNHPRGGKEIQCMSGSIFAGGPVGRGSKSGYSKLYLSKKGKRGKKEFEYLPLRISMVRGEEEKGAARKNLALH